ncbi:sensor histidine kinase [Actibacterium sp. XHP0104]|uniref:sensor histidine kinase n=1 Tax=Actibacterium sp. XHP0104 TaxID=2984335 RepID=UPI0021E90FE0|nr:sensor histidine kinase [Actibacterium sp. XHP0104]MCV2881597.1 sensor histidine kinase [Actibacterium sp. XHP0104]
MRERRRKRGFVSLNRSPLARKIITFNLMGLVVLVAGVLFMDPGRDSLVNQREQALITQARLVADVFEVQLSRSGPVSLGASEGVQADETLVALAPEDNVDLYVYDRQGGLIAATRSEIRGPLPGAGGSTAITDMLNRLWNGLSALVSNDAVLVGTNPEDLASGLVLQAVRGETVARAGEDVGGGTIFSVATPIMQGETVVGAVALTSAAGEIDQLIRAEREQVLRIFVVALLVSVGLSLLLANTIANPLADLAAAAEIGRDRNSRKISPGRVRIPDLTARPDEIGRLSEALRGMLAALYDRIDANEQFAADVAHEIKNPLASLRSAVGTMHVAKRDDQREKLLEVIEHDVRRLDRLVSDISNASRLDSELVKEEEERFNLSKLLQNLAEHLGNDARGKGVDFISDLPKEPIIVQGLEARLAQVFVNLITNAVSFCEEGDAVRIWARSRGNRVLVVVEDTGPGIPDQALDKIFKRFYSERPPGQFGDHSGLGLAISKQIVEAHGGVIWAENIRPTDADPTSEPLGARFVVGLPV